MKFYKFLTILIGIILLFLGIDFVVKTNDLTPYIAPSVAVLVASLTVFINIRLSLKDRRIEWVNKLNDHFSEFFATLSDRRKKDFEFYKHRTSLELLLDESKPLQNDLLDLIDKVGMKITHIDLYYSNENIVEDPSFDPEDTTLLDELHLLTDQMIIQMKIVLKEERKKINTWI